MYVSMNELKSSLKRCFEAYGYSLGNYEDATDAILWLEIHGLKGLAEFEKSLPYLMSDKDKSPSTILYEDKSALIIDCNGRSTLNCADSMVDLAQNKALETGLITIILHHCYNRKFILKRLVDLGQKDFRIKAFWQSIHNEINGIGAPKQTKIENIVSIKSGEYYPHFSEIEIQNNSLTNKNQTLTIILCSSGANLSCENEHHITKTIINYSPEQLTNYKANSIDNGIKIDPILWKKINKIGEVILVEDNAQSHQGAGESWGKFIIRYTTC